MRYISSLSSHSSIFHIFYLSFFLFLIIEQLELEDQDQIDVYLEQQGGL
jgi:hypothetical protein